MNKKTKIKKKLSVIKKNCRELLKTKGQTDDCVVNFVFHKKTLLESAIKDSIELKKICKNSSLEFYANKIYDLLISVNTVVYEGWFKGEKSVYYLDLDKLGGLNFTIEMFELTEYKFNVFLFLDKFIKLFEVFLLVAYGISSVLTALAPSESKAELLLITVSIGIAYLISRKD